MKKKELIAKIAEELTAKGLKLSKKDIETVIATQNEVIATALAEGKEEGLTVTLPGFGTFKTSFAQEREGVNPSTREKTLIPSSYRVGFRAAKALKDKVNER